MWSIEPPAALSMTSSQSLGLDGIFLVRQLQNLHLVHHCSSAAGQLLGHIAAFEARRHVKAVLPDYAATCSMERLYCHPGKERRRDSARRKRRIRRNARPAGGLYSSGPRVLQIPPAAPYIHGRLWEHRRESARPIAGRGHDLRSQTRRTFSFCCRCYPTGHGFLPKSGVVHNCVSYPLTVTGHFRSGFP